MTEPNDEKLLPSGETQPLLSTHEFLKTTPAHELKNIFGKSEVENFSVPPSIPVPSSPTQPPKKSGILIPSIFKNNTTEVPLNISETASAENKKPEKNFLRWLTIIFLTITIFIVFLYIWGGIIKLHLFWGA